MPTRRAYDSTLRQERAAETRDRIVAAGAELLRGASIRDWQGLTIRAVAEHAGVNERTVYRHLTNERGLRDAVMRRLEHEAGIDLDGLRLEDVTDVAARIFRTVAAHPLEARPPLDPTLSAVSQRHSPSASSGSSCRLPSALRCKALTWLPAAATMRLT